MDAQTRILILEDVDTDAELIERELRKAKISFTSQRVETKEGFGKAVAEFDPEIILSDYSLPQFSGLEALRFLKEAEISVPFILVTGSLSEEIAVLCMKEGATDYILKSNLTRLPSAVEAGLKQRKTEKEKAAALAALQESQEQLRQSQKLEGIGQLAGGIAHDFNNLLTIIGGFTSLAIKDLPLDSPIRSNLEEVKKAGDRASSLTRQLLAFSRKQVLQPEVLNLDSVVLEIEKMLRRVIGENIDLRAVLKPQLGNIKADPGQIEQIILNLVVNARDSMPHGGKLTIETDNVYLDEEYVSHHLGSQAGPHVMLAVTDTGHGMDQQTLSRIFEPFFTTKELGKGTGLGLSTVYGIVKQSGGNIWVYSEPGRGATFKIYLPRVDDAADEYKHTTQEAKLAEGSETILLVEDEEMLRKLARQTLKGYGYHILEASNGDEAIGISRQYEGEIQLLLTDVIMPGMNGRELSNRLLETRPKLRVLFMSGYTDDAIVHQGVLDESANFIQKPFPPESLAKKVREVLDQSEHG